MHSAARRPTNGEGALLKFTNVFCVNCTLATAAFLAALLQPALAQSFLQWPQNINWQVGTGLDYSEGKYGSTTKTTVLTIPIDARLEFDRFRIDATLPFLDVTGPGVLAGGVVVGTGPIKSRSGLGDLNVTGAFTLTHDDDTFPAIDIGGSVKFPTASPNLGTGKFAPRAARTTRRRTTSVSASVQTFGRNTSTAWEINSRYRRTSCGTLPRAGA